MKGVESISKAAQPILSERAASATLPGLHAKYILNL